MSPIGAAERRLRSQLAAKAQPLRSQPAAKAQPLPPHTSAKEFRGGEWEARRERGGDCEKG